MSRVARTALALWSVVCGVLALLTALGVFRLRTEGGDPVSRWWGTFLLVLLAAAFGLAAAHHRRFRLQGGLDEGTADGAGANDPAGGEAGKGASSQGT